MDKKQYFVSILNQGVLTWNNWRSQNDRIPIDLSGVNLSNRDIPLIDFSGVCLRRAILREANLSCAILKGADLRKADLYESHLSAADLSKADIRESNLGSTDLACTFFCEADLRNASLNAAHIYRTNFRDANLAQADLMGARLVETNIENTNFDDCKIYGISVWNLKGKPQSQSNLIITPHEPNITVDNLKVAQFIHLLLNNEELHEVIKTVTSKVVLILGCFKTERKVVLDALRQELRKHDYLPVLFDFEKIPNQSFIETVSTLAHMSRFVIADITDAKVILQELQSIVPNLPSVPVQPILLQGSDSSIVVKDFRDYPWFLKIYEYENSKVLFNSLKENVILPLEAKAKEISQRRKQFEDVLKVL